MAQQEEVLKRVKEEIEAIEREEAEEQAKVMDVRHELEKYTAKLKENQQKIKHFQNEVRSESLYFRYIVRFRFRSVIYRIALIFRGSLILRISRIWNRSRIISAKILILRS